MDKNTIICFLLILIVLVGFSYLNRTDPKQIEEQKRYNDSIVAIQQQAIAEEVILSQKQEQALSLENRPDSVVNRELQDQYGSFASSIFRASSLDSFNSPISSFRYL